MALTITNEDNILLMARYPDNYFDLAIVDPPYGIGAGKQNVSTSKMKGRKNSIIKRSNLYYFFFAIISNHLDWLL